MLLFTFEGIYDFGVYFQVFFDYYRTSRALLNDVFVRPNEVSMLRPKQLLRLLERAYGLTNNEDQWKVNTTNYLKKLPMTLITSDLVCLAHKKCEVEDKKPPIARK